MCNVSLFLKLKLALKRYEISLTQAPLAKFKIHSFCKSFQQWGNHWIQSPKKIRGTSKELAGMHGKCSHLW
jgi:hypothetical protein